MPFIFCSLIYKCNEAKIIIFSLKCKLSIGTISCKKCITTTTLLDKYGLVGNEHLKGLRDLLCFYIYTYGKIVADSYIYMDDIWEGKNIGGMYCSYRSLNNFKMSNFRNRLTNVNAIFAILFDKFPFNI